MAFKKSREVLSRSAALPRFLSPDAGMIVILAKAVRVRFLGVKLQFDLKRFQNLASETDGDRGELQDRVSLRVEAARFQVEENESLFHRRVWHTRVTYSNLVGLD